MQDLPGLCPLSACFFSSLLLCSPAREVPWQTAFPKGRFSPPKPAGAAIPSRVFPEPALHWAQAGKMADNALTSPNHPLSKLFMGHHATLQHQGCSAASTITSLLELDHSSLQTLLPGLPWGGAELCIVSVCRSHSSTLQQHLLGRGGSAPLLTACGAVPVGTPLGTGTRIRECTVVYVACSNCFPPLQGRLIQK